MYWEVGKGGIRLGQDGLTDAQRMENKKIQSELWSERTKVLINLSNHPSNFWEGKQKEGWEKIIDIRFPNVPAGYNSHEVFLLMENLLNEEIYPLVEKLEGEGQLFFMVQGEFSLCYEILPFLQKMGAIAVPTTEREVVEKEGKKISIFKFIRWRII